MGADEGANEEAVEGTEGGYLQSFAALEAPALTARSYTECGP